jgi:hypothetical protein
MTSRTLTRFGVHRQAGACQEGVLHRASARLGLPGARRLWIRALTAAPLGV